MYGLNNTSISDANNKYKMEMSLKKNLFVVALEPVISYIK